MLFAISDTVWQAAIAAGATVALAYLQFRTRQAIEDTAAAAASKVKEVGETAKVAASKVEEVKRTLASTAQETGKVLSGIVDVTKATHVLVNSSFSAQLKISALALRRIADLTEHVEDIRAAEVAERLHREHEQKQTTTDQGGRIIRGGQAT